MSVVTESVANLGSVTLPLSIFDVITEFGANSKSVIPRSFTTNTSVSISIVLLSTFTDNVFPTLVNPSPAIIVEAPVNWEKLNEFVPTTSLPWEFVHKNPKSSLSVPSVTNTAAPDTLNPISISSDLVQVPGEATI